MTSDHARRVKARHERNLLMLDYVQGVGIGEDHGHPAIKVYVDHWPDPSSRAIPKKIENVPVVVEESGSFRAF